MTDRDGKMTPDAEADLEALFAQARAQKTSAPDALMARIVEDAQRLQPRPMAVPLRAPSVWSQLRAALGGWPALGGLAATALVGVYIGFSDPSLVPVPGLIDQGVEISDFFASDTLFLEEGTS
ncbi:MAG: hypothetical protein JXR14_01920 [Paracoccaceae bacterium]